MDSNKKILIIDDHHLFADGLAMILETSNRQFKVHKSNDAEDSLSQKKKLLEYDLILIDLHMPTLSGFGFLSAIKAQAINIAVAVISGSDKKVEIERAIGLGAQGYIPKNSSSEEFIDAAEQLLQGKRYLPMAWDGEIDWINDSINISHQSDDLTKRQKQVLELMRDGLQNKQIATILGIKTTSVKGHVERLFEKLGVNNRTSCVQLAQERKLI